MRTNMKYEHGQWYDWKQTKINEFWTSLPPSNKLQGGPADMEQGHAVRLHNCKTPQRRERGGCQHRAVSPHSPTHVVWLAVCYCCLLKSLCLLMCHISSAATFQRFTETKLFAQFDRDIRSAVSMSLKFTTGNAFKPKYKLRVLRVRLTPVNSTDRWVAFFVYLLSQVQFADSSALASPLLPQFFWRCWRFTGHCADTTSSWRRAKRSPSNPFPVKSPISERNIGQRIQEIHLLVAARDHPGQPTQEQTWLWTNVTNHTMHICQ